MRRKLGQLVRGQIARITSTLVKIDERDWRCGAAVGNFLVGHAVVGAVLVEIYIVVFVGEVCDEDTGRRRRRCGTNGSGGSGRYGGGGRFGGEVDGVS